MRSEAEYHSDTHSCSKIDGRYITITKYKDGGVFIICPYWDNGKCNFSFNTKDSVSCSEQSKFIETFSRA